MNRSLSISAPIWAWIGLGVAYHYGYFFQAFFGLIALILVLKMLLWRL